MLFSLSPTALVVGLAGLGLTSAHAVMDAVYVNGQPLGHGTAIRLSKANNVRVDPIGSLTSNDMACGKCQLLAFPPMVVLVLSRLARLLKIVPHRCRW